MERTRRAKERITNVFILVNTLLTSPLCMQIKSEMFYLGNPETRYGPLLNPAPRLSARLRRNAICFGLERFCETPNRVTKTFGFTAPPFLARMVPSLPPPTTAPGKRGREAAINASETAEREGERAEVPGIIDVPPVGNSPDQICPEIDMGFYARKQPSLLSSGSYCRSWGEQQLNCRSWLERQQFVHARTANRAAHSVQVL